ncbi:hypothetical protein EDM52_16135 [Brevibacillus invocatus]|uniref:Uncharacterized protein n=1 Tax=Brevibacillus invocatus TaxID=173959 RepID=A0A3M8C683_9BACL|nr:hypothetical protein EDM52_16135 [Brevibacillus invocatus]
MFILSHTLLLFFNILSIILFLTKRIYPLDVGKEWLLHLFGKIRRMRMWIMDFRSDRSQGWLEKLYDLGKWESE